MANISNEKQRDGKFRSHEHEVRNEKKKSALNQLSKIFLPLLPSSQKGLKIAMILSGMIAICVFFLSTNFLFFSQNERLNPFDSNVSFNSWLFDWQPHSALQIMPVVPIGANGTLVYRPKNLNWILDNQVISTGPVALTQRTTKQLDRRMTLDQGKGYVFFSEDGKAISTPRDLQKSMDNVMKEVKDNDYIVSEELVNKLDGSTGIGNIENTK
ncbi:MAG: hypothetical protein MI743_11580, partial [Sneathiellales bacterium]|nr:hypothetical protein [Sneathiellales bacterium]